MMSRVTALLVVTLLAGCGPSWILLTVESALEVTEDVDELEFWVRDPDDNAQLTTFQIPLSEGDEFPLTILLEPGSDNPRKLVVLVEGHKDDQTVASVLFEIEWTEGADTLGSVTLE